MVTGPGDVTLPCGKQYKDAAGFHGVGVGGRDDVKTSYGLNQSSWFLKEALRFKLNAASRNGLKNSSACVSYNMMRTL